MANTLRPNASWAGTSREFGMPTMDAYEKPFIVKVDGQELGVVKPNIDTRVFQRLDARIQQLDVSFLPAVMKQSRFLEAKVTDESMVKQLLGNYSITDVSYVDAQGQPATQATQPGRYGAIATLKSESGKEIKCYKTLFRLPARFAPAGTDAEKARVKEALDKNELGHATAVLMAAIDDRLNQVDAWVSPDDPARRDKRWWYRVRARVLGESLAAFYTYRPHLPPDYDKDKTKLWPMIIYLTEAQKHPPASNSARAAVSPSATAIPPAKRETREWTSRNNQKVTATLEAIDGDRAILRNATGRKMAIPIALLIAENQAYIETLGAE